MKIRKHISKMLLIGMIANNFSVLSNAGALSPDTRYETFEGSSIKIDDVIDSSKISVEVEGNTLVNLADIQSSFEIRDSNDWYKNYTVCETSKLKLNTDYTFFIYKELLSNHNENYNYFQIGVGDYLNSITAHPVVTINNVENLGAQVSLNKNKMTEIVKIKVNFKDFKGFKYLGVRPLRRPTEPVSTEYCNANVKIVLLEGDWTNENIDYFTGMKSVGEIGSSLDLKYSNKNLYPYGDIATTWGNGAKESLIGWIKVKPNTTYTVSRSNNEGLVHFIEFRDNTKTFLQHNHCYSTRDGKEIKIVSSAPIAFTTGSDINYLYVTASSGTVETNRVEHKNIMLEEGGDKTEYETNKEIVKSLNLLEPLRAIPGGKRDRIIKKNGLWMIERNCKEVVVNINSNNYNVNYWTTGAYDTDTLYAFYISSPKVFGTYSNPIYTCSGLMSDRWQNIDHVRNKNKGVCSGLTAQPPYIGFKIEKEVIDSYSGATIREKAENYFKSLGDMKFILELLTPIYEPLNVDLDNPIYSGTTHILTNSTIPPNIKVTIDRVVNRAKEFSEIAKTNPTSENISRARMWLNLIEDSILKDELQEEINSITNISDITLERKSVTSNLDVYIKSANMLSLSLSTNSIIFDDYSGVEDMEKLNAVNLIVNSSLPYKVNSYLVNEIQNADKSETLDKSILNIKSSSDTNYKEFVDTINPVVLLDDQSSGNDILHSIDLKLKSNLAYKADVYKTVLKFEIEQK